MVALETRRVEEGAASLQAASAREDDEALLAGCLSAGEASFECRHSAAALLARFGSLSGVLSATPEALSATAGVGIEGAASIRRAHEFAVRLARAEIAARPIISSWTALLSYAGAALRHERREQFRVLFLDVKNQLIRDEVLGLGTVDHAPVYPREVIRRALELCASNLILVHNHPGGDPTPSRADIDMTKQVIDAGRLLKIGVHDHLIVGREGVASFKSLGLI